MTHMFRFLLALVGMAWPLSPVLAAPVVVGRLPGGVTVEFRQGGADPVLSLRSGKRERVVAARPVQIEYFHSETDIRTVRLSYRTATRAKGGVVAEAVAEHDGATIRVEDRYAVRDGALQVRRSVRITGRAPGVGFATGLFMTAPGTPFADDRLFMPGVLYGGPGLNNAKGPAGSIAFASGSVAAREDALPAPLVGVALAGGGSVALLNIRPTAKTTEEDTRANAATVLIDERFGFGAFGARAATGGDVEFGYWLPGTVTEPEKSGGAARRRYHPLRAETVQTYELALRFTRDEDRLALVRNAWRWAYATLAPKPARIDLDTVRRVVTDQLADRVTTVDGRTGLPWIHQITTGKVWHRPDDMRAALGFVGKNIEAANIMLIEADRDPSPRGQSLRQTALAIIDTFVGGLTMSPPSGEAIDLATGRPTVSFPPSSWRGNLAAGQRVFVRALSEDMRKLTEAYLRERERGRDHPNWLAWATDFADWLVPQQRSDGSFPRAWRPGTGEVVETSSSQSYAPVPMLALLAEAHGERGGRYRDAALRGAEHVWQAQGRIGVYTGGTLDFPDVTDKEAGMLSMEAFLAAYDLTRDRRWIDRAAAAADFTETWMYLWDVPMAVDAIEGELHWKKGVPTTGVNVVVIGGRGLVDQYLTWSTPTYARLYQLTGDPHYLDVARIQLRNSKAMLAMPGRTFDTVGPGWQQENFDLSLRRGYGGHRAWLPWVSVHHLWSIIGTEQLDPALYRRIAGSDGKQQEPANAR